VMEHFEDFRDTRNHIPADFREDGLRDNGSGGERDRTAPGSGGPDQ
jgi:hypothetical protein